MIKKMRKIKLRTFIAFLYLIALIPLITFDYLTYQQDLRARKNLALNGTLETAKTVAVGFKAVLIQAERTLKTASLSLQRTSQDQWLEIITRVKQDNPEFLAILVLNKNGQKIVAFPKETKPPKSKDLQRLSKKEAVVTDIFPQGKFGAQFFILVKVRLALEQDLILAGLLSDKTIKQQLAIKIGRQGNVGIIDPTGKALFLTHVPKLAWQDRDRTFISSIRKALKGKPATTPGFYDPLAKQVRLGGSAPVKKIGWVANVFLPEAEVLAPIRRQAVIISLEIFLISLVILFIVLALSQQLAKPISLLVKETKPFQEGHYEHRLPEEFFLTEVSHLARSLNLAAAETQRLLEQERSIALRLQKALLPIEPPKLPGYQFGTYYASATERALVGGDFYDFILLSPTSLGIVIGDVQGKGVDSAVTTATIKFILRDIALRTASPAQALTELNKVYYSHQGQEEFITLIYIVLNLPTGVFTYASAGHPPPLVCQKENCFWLEQRGPALGILAEAKYPVAESNLTPGAFLLLYTDGLIEARRGKELFGFERLQKLVAENINLNAQELTNLLYRSCLEFGQGRLLDDLAIIVLGRSFS